MVLAGHGVIDLITVAFTTLSMILFGAQVLGIVLIQDFMDMVGFITAPLLLTIFMREREETWSGPPEQEEEAAFQEITEKIDLRLRQTLQELWPEGVQLAGQHPVPGEMSLILAVPKMTIITVGYLQPQPEGV